MKYLLSIICAGFIAVSLNAQSPEHTTFRTHSNDSTSHYFLEVKKLPLLKMPNAAITKVDTAALKAHPMVKDPLDMVDLPELIKSGNFEGGFRKYDFQNPEKFRNELNFNPKFRK